ncbi:MAG: actin-bundling T4SS effector WalE1 family protein [Wolbachia sp.]
MLNHEQQNSSPKQNSTFIGTVQDKLKDIKNFSNWSAKEQIVAVGAVGIIFGALLPVLAAALPVAATFAAVALTLFFAYKAVEYTFKGLKWSAEKTVDGAKYTAEKVKDASVYTAGKIKNGAVRAGHAVKEGYEHSVNSLKKGASFVGEGMADKFHKAAGETDYLDKIKRFTPEEIKKSDEIRKDIKAIFADKGNNAGLIKNILSGISSKIDSKIAEEAKSGWMEHTSRWQVEKEFINNLNEGSLHSLLISRSLPKGSYFIDSVFSEHHDEIKEVIKECKENHLHLSVANMFNTAEKKANRPSLKGLTRSVSSSFSSLRKKGSTQSTSSASGNSLSDADSIKTDSTGKTATIGGRPGVARRNSTSNPIRVETPEVPDRSISLPNLSELGNTSGQSSFSGDVFNDPTVKQNLDSLSNSSNNLNSSSVPTPVVPPKVPGSPVRSNSPDSGKGPSAPSTPERQSPSPEELTKARARLKKTGSLDTLVEPQKPSTTFGQPAATRPSVKVTEV